MRKPEPGGVGCRSYNGAGGGRPDPGLCGSFTGQSVEGTLGGRLPNFPMLMQHRQIAQSHPHARASLRSSEITYALENLEETKNWKQAISLDYLTFI